MRRYRHARAHQNSHVTASSPAISIATTRSHIQPRLQDPWIMIMCAMLHLSFSGVENLERHLDCRQTPSSQTRGPRESYDPALGASAAATRTRSPLAMAKERLSITYSDGSTPIRTSTASPKSRPSVIGFRTTLPLGPADRHAPALPGRLAPTTLQQKPA